MINQHTLPLALTNPLRADDDDLEDEDDFEDEDEDADGDDEDEDKEDEEESETWQVGSASAIPLKGGSCLTSGIELPRLAGIFQLC